MVLPTDIIRYIGTFNMISKEEVKNKYNLVVQSIHDPIMPCVDCHKFYNPMDSCDISRCCNCIIIDISKMVMALMVYKLTDT